MAGETFTARAARLAGLSAVLIGWRPDDFWAATPDELAGVLAALMGDDATLPPDMVMLAKLKEQFPDG